MGNVLTVAIEQRCCTVLFNYERLGICVKDKMRDDFPLPVKDLLDKRVAFRCSNPACRKPTSGPQEDPEKSINIGVAAHITAASPDGARYNPSLTNEGRRSAANGIWLCQSCGKLVDNDENRYTVEILQHWKAVSESAALRSLESRTDADDNELLFLRLEQLMPDFLEEIRKDLTAHPLKRLFVPLSKKWTYWASGDELCLLLRRSPRAGQQTENPSQSRAHTRCHQKYQSETLCVYRSFCAVFRSVTAAPLKCLQA